MSTTLEYIAERVKYFRTQQNLSLEELANKSDVTRNYIWQIEQATANVSINKLEAICTALNIDLFEVLPNSKLSNDSALLLANKINSLPEENKELVTKILRLSGTLKNQRDLQLVIDLLQSMHRN
jgi:transcriptional regulator with XRE-family HTH domain